MTGASRPANVLTEAAQLVLDGERRRAYGEPVAMCRRIAAVWTALTGHELTERDVPVMLAAVKLCREAHRHSRDNLVDIAGYALIAELVDEPLGGGAPREVAMPRRVAA